jgi:hypothetical protein
MKYQFIAAHQQEYPVKTMCRVLEVEVSGYYAWLRRLGAPSRRSQANTGLGERIVRIYQANRQVYRGAWAVRAFTRCYEPKGSTAGGSEWPGSCVNTG